MSCTGSSIDHKRNELITAWSFVNECHDDLSTFKSILECYSFTLIYKIYQQMPQMLPKAELTPFSFNGTIGLVAGHLIFRMWEGWVFPTSTHYMETSNEGVRIGLHVLYIWCKCTCIVQSKTKPLSIFTESLLFTNDLESIGGMSIRPWSGKLTLSVPGTGYCSIPCDSRFVCQICAAVLFIHCTTSFFTTILGGKYNCKHLRGKI